MKTILNKLRSRRGASMILAMLFMLFCCFIGGTVLASATANAQRVAQMAEQQDFLLERSAALLVSDQLQLDNGDFLRMSVVDADKTIQPVIVHPNGSVTPNGEPTFERVITFQVLTNTTPTPMHRLMLEATVWRYLLENQVTSDDTILLQNFPGSTGTSTFFLQHGLPDDYTAYDGYEVSGSMNVTATSSSVDIPDYIANFSCGRGEHNYDFFVDFGENSQVRMTLDGYCGTTSPIQVVSPATETAAGTIQVTTDSTQTTISWENPLIEKGGAA